MDLGRIIIGLGIFIHSLYSLHKKKESKVLILTAMGWFIAFHSGTMNIFQYFNMPLSLLVGAISMFLFLISCSEFMKLYNK
ncbi:hypothetical protein SAMN02745245_01591 [Anaerosphaera aminiphila DSM 21120]|uniref:Inner membrane protein n=1 Tax=Anaerosphaera aminiphila DSM 21120 TaxID=1120995 RepID=A0A1M5TW83_9FIRM|nr:hypothetical protein [Anaerosphaera aminiphila]SHH54921.1 hypothetical protein SAMN02745245_01591 [Anaerosphaera aminiphila DSM 21120]